MPSPRGGGRIKLGWRFVAVYLALGGLALVFLASFTLTQSANAMRDQVDSQLTNSAAVSSLYVRSQMQRYEELVGSYASRRSLVQSMGNGNPRQFDLPLISSELAELNQTEPVIDFSFVTDPAGVVRSVQPQDPTALNQDLTGSDWYSGAIGNGGPYVSNVYQATWGFHPLVVAVASPIWQTAPDGRPIQMLGFLVTGIGLDSLQSLTSEFSNADGLTLTITDDQGVLVGKTGAAPESMVSLASDPRIAAALKGKAGLFRQGSGARQILSGYSPVSGLGWTVLVESKAAVALAEIYAVAGTVLILTGIVSLIFLGGAVVIVLVLRGRDRDAAQIRSLNAELAQRAAVTQAVLDNIADGISVSDEQGNLSFNPAAERIMGTKVTGAPLDQWPSSYGLFLPDGVTPYPAADLPMARARRGESVQQTDIFVRSPGQPDGIWINVSASPLRINGKLVGGISIFRDVTTAKRHQDAVTKLNAELAQRVAERDATNKELEAFTYSVSHDLRAPLRAIHGFVRILQEEYTGDLEGEARRYLDLVATNAKYMGQLVDDLLQFSRTGRQGLTKQPVLTTAVARRAIEELRSSLDGRDVQFSVGQLPACQADPTLLLQVYVNLIGNAIKYTRGRQPAVVEVGSLKGQDGEPVYFVKDNGTGFDMKYAHKLFGVFQRLHRSEEYEGTGVGLAIVQRIVARHGGRVWAEAEPGKGATFYFTLGGTAAWQPSIAA